MSSDLTLAQRRTLLKMARAADVERSGGSRSPIERADRGTRLPLSFAQSRLWFLEQLGGLGSAYHIRARRRLRGPLHREALGRALDRIVARHEALRTTFVMVNGEPEQRIAPEGVGFRLGEHDLSGHPDAAAELERLAAEEGSAPFSLERGPLIRGRLIRMGPEEHFLLLTMHHIVADGWSTGVFFNEMGALYGAFQRGEPDPLPPLEVQYADYAAWQRRWLDGEVLRQQSEYWGNTLAGAPELLELPTDRARPPVQDHAGGLAAVELDEELTAGLKALGARHGTTLFMTLLAGWAIVLGRLSCAEDVVIGTPSANRGRREIEGLIGFFVNTLALRLDLSGSPSVAELLGRVKARTLEAQDHQDIPFEQVVERVQPVRSLAYSPLFQVMFAWQSASGAGLALQGLEAATGRGVSQTLAKFDLLLTLSERDGRIAGGAEYATALFERATVERYLGYLRVVLKAMADDDRQAVDALPLLSAEERRQVVEGWNATGAPYPRGVGVHELFEAQVRRAPHAVAVVDGDRSLTYAELNARANRVARALAARGLGADTRVAILIPRSAELVAAELAVLKAGAAYVPLDATYPAERTASMVADSGSPVVLSRSGETVPGLPGVERIDLDTLGEWSEDDLGVSAGGEAVAYVMYTSGSTGEPKGVMVPHRAIAQLVLANGQVDLGPGDRVAMAANPAFDAATMEVWGALLNGGRVVVVDQDVLLDPHAYGRLLRERGVTALLITPVLFNQYAEVIPEALAGVRHVLTGGDRALPAAYARIQGESSRAAVHNCYGPTETTCFSVAHAIGAEDLADQNRSVPIGRPRANARAYVLDGAGAPVPVGVVGELYLGGAGVAHGYWRRRGLTAERFVPDPFGPEPGGRLYRTGDLVRRRADGRLEFIGRTDFQVKVRGFRVELGEIEGHLAEHPAVSEGVVVAREDTPGGKRLVAYYVARALVEPDVLRTHLAGRLPEYMVPAAYVRLEALPLSPNGKVDRRALPAPDDDASATRGYEAPVGEVEAALAEVWAEVLGLERVGRHDNFFELGGHSLLAVTLIERMRQHGLPGDVRALYTRPTLAALAAEVEGGTIAVVVPPNAIPAGSRSITPGMLPLVELTQAQIDSVVAAVPGGAANVQDIYPLAPLQEGILFHHLLSGERDPYVVRKLSSFDARERLDAYLGALQAVVDRHDILRTAIAWEGLNEPVQVVWRQARLRVEEVELDPAGDAAEQLYARLDPRRQRVDVRRAPMLRVCVAHDAAGGRWLLLLLQHHLAGDHTTLAVMQSEVEAHLAGRTHTLAAPLPFRNFVAHARLGTSPQEHELFFREMLGDVEEPTVPFGLVDVQGDGSRVSQVRERVDPGLALRIRAEARRYGVSAASLCHLAWAQVLARVSGRADVVFGTLLFGRMQGGEGADRVMGLFINTLPIRVRVGEESVEDALPRVHRLLAELLRHEHAPLSLAQRCSGVQAPAPLFTSLLNYRHSRDGVRAPERDPVWSGTRSLRAEERTNYPVTLSVDDLGQGFGLTAQAEAPADPAQLCSLMHTALERLVEALETAPGTPLASVDVLPAGERRRVVAEWNDTDAAPPGEPFVHRVFEARARRAPGSLAVVHGGEALSYAELNARANRLAHHLAERGVGPEVRVAICVERGLEMVVAVLAVLKAGGAYVPLDPSYPAERLRYMLRDSAPAVLLARAPQAERFAELLGQVAVVDLGAPVWLAHPAGDPEPRGLIPDNLAYVIYTSGSTGRPKGVMVAHRNAANLVAAQAESLGLDAASRVLQFAPFSFDAWVFEVAMALCTGASLHIPPGTGVLAGEELERVVEQGRITHVTLPPAVLSSLPEDAEMAPVRTMVLAGDVVPGAAVKRWAPGRTLLNAYGPTETAVWATFHPCAAGAAGNPCIGRPIRNTRLYLLNGAGEPAPAGVAGELYIGGAGVARGYVGRPALTAERFVPDPFSGEPGARLYRTGDVGRWLPDGTLDFMGRNDHQVKVRGFRVEIGEIEARLGEHAAVREAVVLCREDAPGDARLVAYWAGPDEVDAAALRRHVARALPEYMVPAAYVRLDEIPLTPSGKVDRRALPAPEGGDLARGGYEAPVGETEAALAGIWTEVLGVERVGRRDNFFELGGHSLLAVRVASRVRQVWGSLVALGDLFSHPTIESLAALLEGAERWARSDRAIAIRPDGPEAPLFLVHEGAGSVAYAQLLLPHVDPRIPLYALPAPSPAEAPLGTVEAMAARLAGLIRDVRPTGPYRLAGWSFGGVLAYEAAAQLLDQGHHVEFVGMMDSYHPDSLRAGAGDGGEGRALLLQMLRMEAGGPGRAAEPDDPRADAELAAWVERCRDDGTLPGHVSVAQAREMRDRLRAHGRSLRAYRPRPLPVPVHLFPAQDDAGADPRRGWQAVLDESSIHVTPVPGTHLSMMTPANVGPVGQALSRGIRLSGRTSAAAAGASLPLPLPV